MTTRQSISADGFHSPIDREIGLPLPPGSNLPQREQPVATMSTLRLYVFFFLAFLSVSSGIIASSDGVTIFNVTQALIEDGGIAVKGDNVAAGVDGRLYSRYGIGLSLATVPFYLLGKVVAAFAPIHLTPFVLKGVASLTNAAIGALVCILLFLTAVRFGYSQKVALQLTIAFAFSTFFIVYVTKSFLTQPLESLCILGAIYHLVSFRQDGKSSRLFYAGIFGGIGILTKWFFVINLPILAAYPLISSSRRGRRPQNLILFAAPAAGAFAVGLWYNFLRFGSIWQTGYFGITSFSTPLLVGLYGLLLSSGKSLVLYAPVTLLGLLSLKSFVKHRQHETWLFLGLFLINLLAVAKYRDWGGDGAWGPRYLTLVLPCLILPIGALFERGTRAAKRGFVALILLGILVHVGGVSVYYGTYFRIIGEFPYEREITDPLFLYKVRYIPNYSPAWGQFEMAMRNWRIFLRGERPAIAIAHNGARIPLSETDREKLTDTLDLWFAYSYYAGLPFSLCLLGMTSLMGSAAVMGWRIYRSCTRLDQQVEADPHHIQ